MKHFFNLWFMKYWNVKLETLLFKFYRNFGCSRRLSENIFVKQKNSCGKILFWIFFDVTRQRKWYKETTQDCWFYFQNQQFRFYLFQDIKLKIFNNFSVGYLLKLYRYILMFFSKSFPINFKKSLFLEIQIRRVPK